jgi:hypothetical protein
MPIDLEIWRRNAQQLALQALGKNARQPRSQIAEVRSDGFEGDILSMPQALMPALQTEDGEWIFMADMDAIDGGAIIA